MESQNLKPEFDRNTDVFALKTIKTSYPIKIGEVNLCEIAEKMDWALNVDKQLSNLTKQQQEAILVVIEGDKYKPPVKRRRTVKKMKSSIFNYVKKKCYCVAFAPWAGHAQGR